MTNDLTRLREWLQGQHDSAVADYKAAPNGSVRGAYYAESLAYGRVVGMVDRMLAKPGDGVLVSVESDARIDGTDGDATLRNWLDRAHNPLGSDLEMVVAELARRALRKP